MPLLRTLDRERWRVIALTGLEEFHDGSNQSLGGNPVHGQLNRAAVGLQFKQSDKRVGR